MLVLRDKDMISHLAESVSFRYGWGREIMREERSRIRDQRSEGEGGRWGVIAESLFVLVCVTRDATRCDACVDSLLLYCTVGT